MARGGRRYARDSRGRFASTGTTAKGARIGGSASSGKKIRVGDNRIRGSVPRGGTIIKGTNGRPGMGPASKASAPKAAAKPAVKKRPGLSPEKRALAGELGKMRGQMRAQNQASPNQRIRDALTKDAVAYAKGNLAAKAGKPKAANEISASPRRLGKSERIAAEVMASGKFRSDRQRVNEMIRRGVDPKTDFVKLVRTAKSKGTGPKPRRR